LNDQADPPQARSERVVLGMAAAMGAFFMFTVMNLFAKLLSANHSVIEIAFYRNLIASVPFLLAAFAFGRREILVLRSKPMLVGVRAAIGALSLVTTFAAFSLMPMADTTVLLFTSGGYQLVVGGLLRTFEVLPLGAAFDLAALAETAAEGLTGMFLAALQIAGPLIAVLFLADIGLGLLTRVAPALNAFALGFPLKILLTILLAVSAYVALPQVVDSLTGDAIEGMLGVAG